MRLARFILQNLETILVDWEAYARTVLPATAGMNPKELRDHAQQMLEAIASDMETEQSAGEQKLKSEGERRRTLVGSSASETHASDRFDSGFTLNELVGEYRALRASVIRVWTYEIGTADRANLEELTRFNEALDEALTDAIARFTQQISRERELLLGALGHDLRTPLSAVMTSAHLLARVGTGGDLQKEAVTRILTSGTRMKDMIAECIDLAQIRMGEPLPMTTTLVDMGDACRSTIKEFSAVHPENHITFFANGNLLGNWDAGRIGKLISNLIANAINHGEADRPIQVNASSSGPDEAVTLSVRSHGTPIPQKLQPRIFEPLARGVYVPPTIPKSGHSFGLGLYISSEIAKAHGGSLKLGSSDEQGTTFVALLPRAGSN